MRIHKSLFLLFFFILLNVSKSTGQCFTIESVLVDACSPNIPSNDEGFNEMVRFKVGTTAIDLNITPLNLTWPNPSNLWLGLIKNTTTAAKVATLNADIASAGSCGLILEPIGGILPANAEVILVTSQNFSVVSNSFATLTGTIYMIFQNNPSQIGGHFANYNVIPSIKTLIMSFGTCSQSVSYNTSLLLNNNGSAVNYSPTGVPTYINNGCNAPIPPFVVNAGASQTACKGSTISLTGTAQGQQTVLWSAPTGTFSNPTSLSTNYSIDPNAPGTSITLTLTITNICNVVKTSTVVINFSTSPIPTVTSPITYCPNAIATPLSATASPGGVLNWYGTNATGGTATTLAPTPSTTSLGSTSYYVSQTIAGCESLRVPIVVTILNTGPSLNLQCVTANSTQTSLYFQFDNVGQTNYSYSYSVNGGPLVSGNFATPNFFIVNGLTIGQSVTFNLTANGVACVGSQSATCSTVCATTIAPNFAAIPPICINATAPVLALTSPNGITGTWSPATINTALVGTTPYVFTPNSIAFPCAGPQTLNVTVNPIPTLSINSPSVCQGAPATLIATPTISGTYSYTWTVPAGVTNPGNVPSFGVTTPGIFNAVITNTATGCVSASASGTVSVNTNPIVTVNGPSFCQGSSTTITAIPAIAGAYTYIWTVPSGVASPGNVSNFSSNAPGIYSVIITDSNSGCSSASSSATVSLNPNPNVSVNSSSVNQGTPAIVTAMPSSNSSYSFNWTVPNGVINPGNVASFSTLTAGSYSVVITDSNSGCISASATGYVTINSDLVIDYPHYFTPNGDGIHDYWNIKGLDNFPSAKIYIFDRYGKLIKQIFPKGPGWDGTYNGSLLPATDYWFTLDYIDASGNKQLKAHFSLLR